MELTTEIFEMVDDELRCIQLDNRFKFIKAQLDKPRPEATFMYKDNDSEVDMEIKYSVPKKFFGAGVVKDIETLMNICKSIHINANYKMQNINIGTRKVKGEYYNKQDGTSITISTLRGLY